MRPVLAFVLSIACGVAGAVEIRDYTTRVDVGPDGSAQASASVALSGALPGRLRVPVGFARIEALRPLEAAPGVTMAAGGQDGISWVDVELPPGIAEDATISFAFRSKDLLAVPQPEAGQKPVLPAGSQLLRHRFVNTQEAPIGHYAVKVLLPPAAIVHRITEQSPRPGRKEFVPRVELDRFEGRQGALLRLDKVRQGDRASMELEVVAERRSLLWLFLLVPLAAGYLYAFRDLVAAPKPA